MTESNDAADLLREYRDSLSPEPEALARMEAGVSAKLAAGVVVAEPSRGGVWSGPGTLVAGTLVVAMAAAGAWLAWPGQDGAPRGAPAVAAFEEEPPSSPPVTPAVVPEAPPEEETPSEPAAAPDSEHSKLPAPTKQRPASDPPVDQLKAEMALLGRAQAAIADGDAEDALRLLRRHASRYPGGYLVPERLLQEMVALCELGHKQKARRKAQRFLRERPDSPLAAHVGSICTEE